MDDIKQEITEAEKAKKQCEEYLAGWKRAQADLVNYRKDEQARFGEFAKFAQEAILKDLVTVMDSIALAAASIPDNDPAHKGLVMIKGQFESLMGKYGLEIVSAKVGSGFNPSIHEAVSSMKPPEGEEGKSDTIAEEVGKGYALHGKTLRPARVKIFE